MREKSPAAVRDRLLRWALDGQTDRSSLAIAGALMHGMTDDPNDFPREPVNLQSCVLLIQTVPEARNAFPILARSSQHWAELIADWETLTESLRAELHGDLQNKALDRRSCGDNTGIDTPMTYALIGRAIGTRRPTPPAKIPRVDGDTRHPQM